MSRSIDERIVDMQFNNKQFEDGIKDSLDSLDKMNKGLNDFDGASKGLEQMAESTEKLGLNFGALEIIAITAISKITDSIMDFGINTAKALTLDPITSGFKAFEEQTTATKAIMNASARSVEDVEKALEKLTFFADETSYSFDDMIKGVTNFTGAGVKLEGASTAMQGIASWAALSGVNSATASRAFSAMSDAIGAGAMKLQDWKQIENVKMGTVEFKEEAIKAALAMGTLTEYNGKFYASFDKAKTAKKGMDEFEVSATNFKEALKEGWLSAEVLMQVMGKYGAFADQVFEVVHDGTNDIELASEAIAFLSQETQTLGERGFRAAQEARTLTDAIESITSSISAKWRGTWRLLIGDVDEATELWSNFTEVLWDLFVTSGDVRNNLLQLWRGVDEGDLDGRTILLEGLANIGNSLISIINAIKEAWGNIFPEPTREALIELTEKFRDFTERLILNENTLNNITRTFSGLFAVVDIVRQVLGFLVQVVGKVVGTIFPFADGMFALTGGFGDFLVHLRDVINESKIFGKALETIGTIVDTVKNTVITALAFVLTKFAELLYFIAPYVGAMEEIGLNIIGGLFVGLKTGIVTLKNIAITIGTIIYETFKNFFGIHSPSTLMIILAGFIIAGLISGLIAGHADIAAEGSKLGSVLLSGLKVGLDAVGKVLSGLVWILKKAAEGIGWAVNEIRKYFSQFGGIDLGPIKIVTDATKDLFSPFTAIANVAKAAFNGIKVILTAIGNAIKQGLAALGIEDLEQLINWLFSGGLIFLLNKLLDVIKPFTGIGDALKDILDSVSGAFEGLERKLKAEALLKIALAIGVLVAAILILANVPWEKLAKGLSVIGLLGLELVLLSKLGGTMDMVKMGVGMTALGIGLLELIAAIALLQLLSWEAVTHGIKTIAALMITIELLGKLANGAKLMKLGGALALIGLGLTFIAAPLLLLALIPFKWLADGLASIAAILITLGIASKLTDTSSVLALSGSLGILAVGLTLLLVPLTIIGLLPFDVIGQGLLTLGITLGILAGTSRLLKDNKDLLKFAAALGIISAAIGILGVSFLIIGMSTWENVAKGLVVFAAAVLVLAGASHIIQADKLAKLGVTLVTVAGIMAILAAMFVVMELLNLEGMLETSISLAAVLLGIAAFVKVMGTIKLKDATKSALALAEFAVALILLTAPFIILNAFDVDNTLETMLSLSGLMIVIAAFIKVLGNVNPAAAAIAAVDLAIFVGIMAAVLAALGGLAQIPGLEWIIGEGARILSAIGYVIGDFIGSIIGGIGAGISKGFPEIGTNLSLFMENLQPFIEGTKNIDPSIMTGVESLVSAILKLTAANLIDGLAGWLTGGKASFVEFGKQLAEFGPYFAEYYESVKDINPNVVSASSNAALALAEMASKLPPSGGAWQDFAGTKDLSKFAMELADFGPALMVYSQSVTGLDSGVVKNSANAALAIAELAGKLQLHGGFLQQFTGTKDLSKFAMELADFGPALMAYANAVDGLPANVVKNSIDAATVIADFANKLQAHGGFLQDFAGTKDLSKFATELTDFGPALVEYAKTVEGLPAGVIEDSIRAATVISDFANTLPKSPSFISAWVGGQDLSAFALQLKEFGPAIKEYSDSITVNGGIDADAIKSSGYAAQVIADLSNKLPESLSLKSWLTGGTQSLQSFGEGLNVLGPAIKEYSDSITGGNGIDSDAVRSSVNAAQILVDFADTLPKIGGLESFFTGKNDLASFGGTLADFGSYYARYSTSISKVDFVKVAEATDSLAYILSISEAVSKADLKGLKTFSDDLKKIGNTGVDGFVKAFTGSDKEVTKAINKMVGYATTEIDKLESNFKKSGGNLMDGFIKGLKAKESELKKVSKNIGEVTILQTIRDALGIASPSKEAINDGGHVIGRYISGLEASIPALEKITESLATDSILGTFRDAMGIHSPSEEMEQSGEDTIDGYVDGTEKKKGFLQNAITGVADTVTNVVDTMTGKMGLKGEDAITELADGLIKGSSEISGIGEYTGSSYSNGIAKGLDENSDKMKKAADEARKKLFESEQASIEHRRRMNELSLDEEFAEWQRVQKLFAKGTDERQSSEQGMINAIIAHRQLGTISLEEEYQAWLKIQGLYSEGSTERMQIEEEIYNLQKRQAQARFDEEEKMIKHRRKLNQLSLEEELSDWTTLRDSYAEGTNERIRAEQAMIDAIIEYRKEGKITYEEEITYLEDIQNKYAEGSAERIQIEQELYDVRRLQTKSQYEDEMKMIEQKRKLNQLTLGEELSELSRIQAKYSESADERIRTDQAMIDAIIEYRKEGKITYEEELAYLEDIQNNYSEYSNERMQIDLEIFDIRKALNQTQFEDEKKILEQKRTFQKLAFEGEVAQYELNQRHLIKTAEDRTRLEKEIFEKRRNFQKASLQQELADYLEIQHNYASGSDERLYAEKAMIDTIMAYRDLDTASLIEEYTAWSAIQDLFVEGSEERIRVDQEILDVRTRITNEHVRLLGEIDKVEEEYTQALNSRTQQIASSFGLFSEVQKAEQVSSLQLMKNLEDQVKELDSWALNLRALAAKGVSEGFLEEISKMGPGSNAEVRALVSMTGTQLNNYVSLWERKTASARKSAEIQLSGMKSDAAEKVAEIEKEIESLNPTDFSKMSAAGETAATKYFEGFEEKTEEAAEQITKAVDDGLKANAESYKIIGAQGGTNFATGVKSTESSAKDAGTIISKSTENAIRAGILPLKSLGTQGGTEFSDGLKDTEITVSNTAKTVAEAALQAMQAIIDSFETAGGDTGLAFAKGITNTKQKIIDAAVDAFQTALDALSGGSKVEEVSKKTPGYDPVKNSFNRVGEAAGEGFVEGLDSQSGNAEKAGENLGKAAETGTKETLKVKSPSKVFEQIGLFSGLGFVNGLETMSNDVENSTTEMGEKAMDGLKNIISKIGEIIENDIDVSPTISPVLDLSELQNGTKAISEMLSESKVITPIAIKAEKISKQITREIGEDGDGKGEATYELNQYNYSPKALNRLEIYRQTKNQFAQLKGLVAKK